MNFIICLLLSLLLSFAICGKNDKKKATVDNNNKNSVPKMAKALRMLTKILAAQSVIGLANGSSPHAGQPTNFADQKTYHNAVDQIMSKAPIGGWIPHTNKMEKPPQFDEIAAAGATAAEVYGEMPTSSQSQIDKDKYLTADYTPVANGHTPINNKKIN